MKYKSSVSKFITSIRKKIGVCSFNINSDIKSYKIHNSNGQIKLINPTTLSSTEIAAVCAAVSRDPSAIENRIDELTSSKEKRIMEFFTKYGHGSIGDLGSIWLSIEGVSMLTAFEFLNFNLVNAQEASTRYIGKFKKIPMYKPDDIDEDTFNLVEKKYADLYDKVNTGLTKYFIDDKGMSASVAKPCVLDIVGGFLPIAKQTNLTIIVSIREAMVHANRLLASEHTESKAAGETLLEIVSQTLKTDIKHDEDVIAAYKHLLDEIDTNEKGESNKLILDNFNIDEIKPHIDSIYNARYINSNSFSYAGVISSKLEMSFRSARDVFRHRSFNKTPYKFMTDMGDLKNNWYIKQLPDKLKSSVIVDLEEINEKFKETNSVYLLPMLVGINFVFTSGFQNWLYFLRLRSGKTVHPELHEIVKNLGEEMAKELGISRDVFVADYYPDYNERMKAEKII